MLELDDILERINQKHAVEAVPLKIAGKTLNVLQIKDFEEYIKKLVDEGNVDFKGLPFWAKVWDASFLLAYFLGKQPVVDGRRMLEIGAGTGVVGLYAALCGHNVTISDVDEDALLFARANALMNGLAGVKILRLDWNEPDVQQRYDVIFGSEVVYDRESYPQLVGFLQKALAPGGIIFLAKNAGLHTPRFFAELTKSFELKESVQEIRTDDECQRICLYAVRRKQGNPMDSDRRNHSARQG